MFTTRESSFSLPPTFYKGNVGLSRKRQLLTGEKASREPSFREQLARHTGKSQNPIVSGSFSFVDLLKSSGSTTTQASCKWETFFRKPSFVLVSIMGIETGSAVFLCLASIESVFRAGFQVSSHRAIYLVFYGSTSYVMTM